MKLELKNDEAAIVKRVLSTYVSDLRMQVSSTEDYDLRQALKHEEAVLKSLIARLDEKG